MHKLDKEVLDYLRSGRMTLPLSEAKPGNGRWSPSIQKASNSDFDRRLGSLETEFSGLKQELETLVPITRRNLEIIEALAEALSQRR